MMRSGLVLFAVAALAAPAAAYHRQTPPIVSYSSGGDTPLPRLAADGRRFVVAIAASGQQIFRLDHTRNFLEQLTTSGDNANPTTTITGSIVAWDTDCTLLGCPEGGRQIFMLTNLGTTQVTHDLSGTTRNPSLSGHGTVLAFESSGDLGLGTNPSGTPQIFTRTLDGAFTQVTHGAGTSGDPVLDRTGRHIVFESTNDGQGNDTHVSQIWLGPTALPTQLTNGVGSSRRAAISSDGKLVAFESTADLTGDLHDTHVPNIFTYEVADRKMTRVTNDPQGCTGASIASIPNDWRIGFACHGQGLFHHVHQGQTYPLPISGGDTGQAVAELGSHFMVVSTTYNLAGSGTTAGHQIYLMNLYKLMGF